MMSKMPDYKLNWKKIIVTDQAAPEFYSEKAIFIFTFFFSVIFGSVMLAINLKKKESKKGVYEVLGFGVLFFVLQEYILFMFFQSNVILPIIFSIVGALVLNYFFWRKYLGRELKYRAKPIWIPLVIGILFLVVYVFLTWEYN